MKRTFKTIISRGAAAVFLAVLMLSLSLGATDTVPVSNEAELNTALTNAATNPNSVLIVYQGVTSITLTSAATIPSNTTISLNAGETLRFTGGTVNLLGTINGGTVEVAGAILAVSGYLTGGTAKVTSGTLVRMSACSITSAVSAPSSGTGEIRYETTLILENLDPSSTETFQTITYYGVTDADDDATFVKNRLVTNYVYPLYGETITKVTTDAGNIFRVGTKTGVLSLEYTIGYYGTTDATFAVTNPTSYTSSDSAITLNNPTKDGYTFDGWTCDQLSLTVPTTTAVIPEGTTGALTFIANWTQAAMPSGGTTGGTKSGGSGTGSGTTSSATTDTDEEDDTETTADVSADTGTTDNGAMNNVRVGKGSSSTKVTFTSDVDEAIPTLESVQGKSFPWGWTLLGVGGSAVIVYAIAQIVRRRRERADMKK